MFKCYDGICLGVPEENRDMIFEIIIAVVRECYHLGYNTV
jgi:hypothetical protein